MIGSDDIRFVASAHDLSEAEWNPADLNDYDRDSGVSESLRRLGEGIEVLAWGLDQVNDDDVVIVLLPDCITRPQDLGRGDIQGLGYARPAPALGGLYVLQYPEGAGEVIIAVQLLRQFTACQVAREPEPPVVIIRFAGQASYHASRELLHERESIGGANKVTVTGHLLLIQQERDVTWSAWI